MLLCVKVHFLLLIRKIRIFYCTFRRHHAVLRREVLLLVVWYRVCIAWYMPLVSRCGGRSVNVILFLIGGIFVTWVSLRPGSCVSPGHPAPPLTARLIIRHSFLYCTCVTKHKIVSHNSSEQTKTTTYIHY